jgi:hypothetical protein
MVVAARTSVGIGVAVAWSFSTLPVAMRLLAL